MVIKYGQLGNLLSNLMYKDKMSATRKGSGTRNSDGSNNSDVLDSFLLNQPCLVQETTRDSSKDDNMDVAFQETVVTVFCHNSCPITKGDILTLSIMDDDEQVVKTIEGFAGFPTKYPDHLEINLYEWKVS